jgi:hypothetical protein
MQEAEPKEQPFFVRNGILMTNAEFVKRMTEISAEIYRRTPKNQANWFYEPSPVVEIKTYDD